MSDRMGWYISDVPGMRFVRVGSVGVNYSYADGNYIDLDFLDDLDGDGRFVGVAAEPKK